MGCHGREAAALTHLLLWVGVGGRRSSSPRELMTFVDNKYWKVSNIDQRLWNPKIMIVPSPSHSGIYR
jgi:hypothetical protein